MSKKVLIAVVNWNDYKATLECLESLELLDYNNFEILLIDNGSTDGSADKIIERYPDIRLFKIKTNLGAAGGRNLSIEYALNSDYDYIFFLDNDAIVEKNTLKELIAVAEKYPSIAAVGAKTYYFHNQQKIWNFGGKISWFRGKFIDSHQGEFDNLQLESEKQVDTFPIGFGIVKTETIRGIGKLDERYFIYYEETDWHVRMRKHGYELIMAPKARIYHKRSSSLGSESPYFYYYRTRNRLLFILKNSPKFYLPFFLLYFIHDFLYDSILTLYLSKKRQELRASIIGLLDFALARFGKRNLRNELLNTPLSVIFTSRFLRITKDSFSSLRSNISLMVKRALNKKLNILIKLDWNLGDEIMAIPLFQAIKEKYPNSTVSVKVRYPELLDHNPNIDKLNENGGFYDKIIDIKGENRGKNRLDYLEKKLRVRIKDRLPSLIINDEEIRKNQTLNAHPTDKLRIAVSTGAKWNSRQWGIANFKKLAAYIADKYGAEIIELGKDCESIGIGVNLINKTSAREAAVILRQCSLFIGNDSGLSHLALSVGTPTVALFGPLSPELLISNINENFIALEAKTECQGCWSKGIMRYPDVCPRLNPDCMESIDLNMAIEAVDNLLRIDNSSFHNKFTE